MSLTQGLRGRPGAAVAAFLALVATAPGVSAIGDAEARGKQIYGTGTPAGDSEITALVGGEGVRLPASAVPCASCHGPDGVGRPEGGVLPPDIRWSELTKTYGHVHENGRRHPAFDEESVAHLVRTGVDPAGNRLDEAMPLYAMSDSDMADLVAYLRYIERDSDPGVDKERIQVATLLPLQGRQGALGRAMAQIMHAHFQEVNRAGGVFGRRIELLVIPYDTSPAATLDKLRKAFEQEGIFALVGAYTVGLDEAVLEALRAQEAPLVGPFTLSPGDEVVNAGTFYLYPGFADQARVLAEEARKVGPGRQGGLLVVGPEGDQVDALVAAVRDQLGMRDAAEPLAMRYPAGALDAEAVAAQVQASSSEAVLFFGDQTDLTDLLGVLAERRQSPGIYLLSSLAPRALFDAPPAFHQRIFLAYPTLSRDISASGRAEYQRLARDHGLPPDHLQGQIAAYAAAKLLVHGLRGAGRNLSRLGLVDALEGLYAYETGLTPPLSYGPNRRVGARGAYVVAVDLLKRSYQPIGGWHNLR